VGFCHAARRERKGERLLPSHQNLRSSATCACRQIVWFILIKTHQSFGTTGTQEFVARRQLVCDNNRSDLAHRSKKKLQISMHMSLIASDSKCLSTEAQSFVLEPPTKKPIRPMSTHTSLIASRSAYLSTEARNFTPELPTKKPIRFISMRTSLITPCSPYLSTDAPNLTPNFPTEIIPERHRFARLSTNSPNRSVRNPKLMFPVNL